MVRFAAVELNANASLTAFASYEVQQNCVVPGTMM